MLYRFPSTLPKRTMSFWAPSSFFYKIKFLIDAILTRPLKLSINPLIDSDQTGFLFLYTSILFWFSLFLYS
jgi:hypothetical protein